MDRLTIALNKFGTTSHRGISATGENNQSGNPAMSVRDVSCCQASLFYRVLRWGIVGSHRVLGGFVGALGYVLDCTWRALFFIGILGGMTSVFGAYGEFELGFLDATLREPVAVRLYLLGPQGRPRRIAGFPYWRGQHAIDGRIVMKLAPGTYSFRVEHGPEYRDVRGTFEIKSGATDSRTIEMRRIVEMRGQGWWPGDCLLFRRTSDLPLALAAEDLYMSAVASKPADRATDRPGDGEFWEASVNRWAMLDCQVVETNGGRLALYGCGAGQIPERELVGKLASSAVLMAAAKVPSRNIAALDSAAWDLPVWVASRRLDAITVLGTMIHESGIEPTRQGWREHDPVHFRQENAAGRWAEHVYFQLLNCGIRIAPIAASGSGLSPNAPGANRVYAHLDGEPTPEDWWGAISAGRVMITNGPLMLPMVNNEYPGHVFRASAGQEVTLQPSLSLYTREKIDYLEIIRDGRILHSIPLDKWVRESGKLPPIKFDQSGWLALRAVTEARSTYRMCLTGPYYVELGGQPRISRTAVQFFLDWLEQRASQLQRAGTEKQNSNEVYVRAARKFWRSQRQMANAE